MRLSWGSLSIGKNGAVKALDNAVDDRSSSVVIYFLLGRIDVEYLIKGELQRLFVLILLILDSQSLILDDLMAVEGTLSLLSLV